jgi:hypothetical protein
MKSVFVIFCVFACTYGLLAKERLNSSTAKQALAEIDNTFYGKLLLDTIDLQLTSGGAIDDIITLLDEIVDELNADQADANDKNATDQAHCEDQGGAYKNEVDTA